MNVFDVVNTPAWLLILSNHAYAAQNVARWRVQDMRSELPVSSYLFIVSEHVCQGMLTLLNVNEMYIASEVAWLHVCLLSKLEKDSTGPSV